MPGGDKCILREETGLETVSGTVVVPFDTTVQLDSIYSVNAGRDQVTVSEAGHYLVTYNFCLADITPAGTNRIECNGALRINGVAQAFGRASGFARGQSTQSDNLLFVSGAAIVALSAGDILSIQAARTDSGLITTVRAPASVSGSGLSIIKLNDDWDYLRLTRTAQGPVSLTSFQSLSWTGQLEVDTGAFGHSAATANEQIRLVGATSSARYLVAYNVGARLSSGTRIPPSIRLTLDDGTGPVEVQGTLITGYIINTNSCVDACPSALALFAGLDPVTGTGNVLELEYRSDNNGVWVPTAGRSALQIARLPDDGAGVSYLRLEEAGGGQSADDTQDLSFDTQALLDAAYSHSVGTATVTVAADGWHLFLAQVLSERSLTASTNERIKHHFEWYVNGTRQNRGDFGAHSRGLSLPTAPRAGAAGATMLELSAGDEVFLRHVNEATGTDTTATFPAGKMSLQAIALEQLLPRLRIKVREVVELADGWRLFTNARRQASRRGEVGFVSPVGEVSQHAVQRGEIGRG